MSLFWENANKLLDAAVASSHTGFPTSDSMTVVIGAEGGIHLLANNDWPLDRLTADRGAQMAYRITKAKGRIAVDGCHGAATCHLETNQPQSKALQLIRDQPRYLLS